MQLRDSRKLHGYVVQDHGWSRQENEVDLEQRIGDMAMRVTGRGEYGFSRHDVDTVGDLLGLQLWERAAGAQGRRVPSWRYAYPAQTVIAGTTTPGGPGGGDGSSIPGEIDEDTRTPDEPTTPSAPLPTVKYIRVPGVWPVRPPTPAAPAGYFLNNIYFVNPNGGAVGTYVFVFVLAAAAPGGVAPPPGPGGSLPNLAGPFNGVPGTVVNGTLFPDLGSMIGSGNLGPQQASAKNTGVPLLLLPERGRTLDPDVRMKALAPPARPYWPSFPVGWVGATLPTMDEDQQVEAWLPTDPRLVAVHKSGFVACGSVVTDLRSDGRPDTSRTARLQTALRVIKTPTGGHSYGGPVGGGTGVSGPGLNTLALVIGVTGQRDGLGGLVSDGSQGGTGTRLGSWSVRNGGIVDVGALNDKHKFAADADGNPISPVHLPTSALITDGASFDGPIHWEGKYPTNAADYGPYIAKVHTGFDLMQSYKLPRDGGGGSYSGAWKWWTTFMVAQSPVTTPSGGGFKNPKPPPFGPPAAVGIGGEPGEFGGVSTGALRADGSGMAYEVDAQLGVVQRFNSLDPRTRIHGVMVAELALTSRLLRPTLIRRGAPDVRYLQGYGDPDAVNDVEATAPVVGRRVAWGAQGGVMGGPYLSDDGAEEHVPGSDPWVRTQQQGVRHLGGMAPGGEVLLPPQVDLSDIDDDFAPAGLELSAVYSIAGPGAATGWGMPELAGGGVRNGHTMRLSASGVTMMEARLADGSPVELVQYEAGAVGFRSGAKLGFHGASPVAQDTGWAVGGATQLRAFDRDDTSTDELALVVATILDVLLENGLIGA